MISVECLHTLTEAFAVCHPTHMWQLSRTYAGTVIARADGSVFLLMVRRMPLLACFFTLTRFVCTFC